MLRILTQAITGDLTVIDTVKTELGITGTSEDTRLYTLIAQASDVVTQFCNRDTFGREEVEQTVRFSRSVFASSTKEAEFIILERDLEVEITSVVEDGTTLTSDEYELDGEFLYRLDSDGDRQEWDCDKVVITYEAGYELVGNLPYAIERACLNLITNMYRRDSTRDPSIRREEVQGVGIIEYGTSQSLLTGSISDEDKASIARYVRQVIA